jgi:hypothetical protein
VDELFTLQVYTPGNDLAAGFQLRQVIWGRSGNDTLLGFQPSQVTQGQFQIDLFIGDVAIDDPAFRQWSDTFVLGDWEGAYYDNGNPNFLGLNDFGFVADFNPALDTIQLNGTASNYQFVDLGVGTAILQQQGPELDVVGFLFGNSNLNPNADYFQYRGSTPPAGPVIPQAQQFGTTGFDIAATSATDLLGNVYVGGGTTGSIGGPNNGDSRDALITKYDNQGNLLWTKQLGTSSFDTVYGIDTDTQGNFYVAGITQGNLFEPKQSQGSDAWVAKYDPNGNQIWAQQFGQNLIFQTFSIDVDNSGNAYLTGIDVRASEDLATDDYWATKFNTNGEQLWFTPNGSVDQAFDESYNIAVDETNGNVYTTGWTLGDLAAPNAGAYDAWVTQYNNAGEIQWVKQLGTSDYDRGVAVDTDSQGNIYVTGWTLGALGGTNAGTYDTWLTKFDVAGNQQWSRQLGSSNADEPFEMFIDNNDRIFLSGYTNGNLGGTNAGSFDVWAAQFDTNGNQKWITQFGTPDFDQAYSITGDNAGNLFVSGVTQGSLGEVNAGSFDGWTAKLSAANGDLLNFNGNGQTVNNVARQFATATTGDSSQTPSTDDSANLAYAIGLVGSAVTTPNNQSASRLSANSSVGAGGSGTGSQLSEDQVNYLKQFFTQLTTDKLGLKPGSGGADGTGLEDLVKNGYGNPNPTPNPVPCDDLITKPDCVTTPANTPVKIKVLDNDKLGDDFTLTLVDSPIKGTAQVNDNGTTGPTDDFILYTPAQDASGTFEFSYQLNSSKGNSQKATVSVSVTPVGKPSAPGYEQPVDPYQGSNNGGNVVPAVTDRPSDKLNNPYDAPTQYKGDIPNAGLDSVTGYLPKANSKGYANSFATSVVKDGARPEQKAYHLSSQGWSSSFCGIGNDTTNQPKLLANNPLGVDEGWGGKNQPFGDLTAPIAPASVR